MVKRIDIFAAFLMQSLCHEVEVQMGLLMFLMFLVKQCKAHVETCVVKMDRTLPI